MFREQSSMVQVQWEPYSHLYSILFRLSLILTSICNFYHERGLTKKNGRFGICRSFSLAYPSSIKSDEANHILEDQEVVGMWGFSYSKNFWIWSASGGEHRLRAISHKYRKNRWQHLGIITMSQSCRSLPNAAGSLRKTISHFPKTVSDDKWGHIY